MQLYSNINLQKYSNSVLSKYQILEYYREAGDSHVSKDTWWKIH